MTGTTPLIGGEGFPISANATPKLSFSEPSPVSPIDTTAERFSSPGAKLPSKTSQSTLNSSNGAEAPTETVSSSATTLMDIEKASTSEEWKPEKKEWIIMISLSIISLMVALDATILVTVLPQITQSLNGSAIDAFWTGTSYLLSNAVFQPVIASISEFFGRQQLLILSLIFFTAGTIVCAVANNFTIMLVGRSIQGIGGGGILTLSQVIFCDIVPLRYRPKYFALVQGSWAVGSIIGPVIGGAFVANTTWRWCFYINFPFCGLGFVLAIFFVRLNLVAKLTLAQKLKQTDWVGALLFLGGTTVFLVGLSWGGVQYAWNSVQTLAPLLLGLAGVAVFVAWQLWVRPHSLLPMSLFYCPSAIISFYCALVNGLLIFSALYYLPFYFMSIRASSPTRAGIELFPALFLLLPGSVIVAALTTRLGAFRWAVWSGWAMTTLGVGLLILLDVNTKYYIIAIALGVMGIGFGEVITGMNTAIQAISKVKDASMAACMYAFMRSLGAPLGVAICGTIFQNAMSSRLVSHGLPESIAHDSERYIYVLRTIEDEVMKAAILDSYSHGFRAVFIFLTGISASALAVSLFVKHFSMDKELQSRFSVRPQSTQKLTPKE